MNALNLYDYGMAPDAGDLPGIPARITAQHKERYETVCQHGIAHARLKTKEYYAGTELFPTVGDFVMLNYREDGDSLITATLPRRTFFSRREPGPVPRDQAVAANFDLVFLMQSLNRDFNPRRSGRRVHRTEWSEGHHTQLESAGS